MLDRYPLICIAAQIETHERAYNFAHQCVDGVSISRPVAKYSHELRPEDDIAAVLHEAFAAATASPPGPAFISIPNDLLKQTALVDEAALARAAEDQGHQQRPSLPQPAELRRAIEILNSADQPMLVVGDTALRQGCTDEITTIAHRCGIPVVSSYAAKGALAPDDPLYYGAITPHMDAVLEYPALEEVFAPADALLLIGYDIAEHLLPAVWSQGKAKTVIRLADYENPTPEHIQPDLDLVVGSLLDTVTAIGAELAVRPERHSAAGLRAHVEHLAAERTTHESGLLPQQVLGVVNDHYPDYILCNDVGYHRHTSALFYRANQPLDFLTSAGLSSFGTGLPFGIGAKLV